MRGCRIGVVGLGYVGLPLAVEFGKHFDTVGFDIKANRIAELKKGRDSTLECSTAELKEARKLKYSTNLKDLAKCRVFIITVPTPIDRYNRPDLTPLERSSETVGSVLKKGDVVVCTRAAPKRSASRSSSASRASSSTRISSRATAPSASTRATSNTVCPASRR
jgi:UDP-N-acetyl-D-mannosaminuronate dehydrogenase